MRKIILGMILGATLTIATVGAIAINRYEFVIEGVNKYIEEVGYKVITTLEWFKISDKEFTEIYIGENMIVNYNYSFILKKVDK